MPPGGGEMGSPSPCVPGDLDGAHLDIPRDGAVLVLVFYSLKEEVLNCA